MPGDFDINPISVLSNNWVFHVVVSAPLNFFTQGPLAKLVIASVSHTAHRRSSVRARGGSPFLVFFLVQFRRRIGSPVRSRTKTSETIMYIIEIVPHQYSV